MSSCRPCIGPCRKEILGFTLHSLADAQKYRGTTVVNGSLEIQIINPHQNISNELTAAFGRIEEITGSLKISRSTGINNLHFFKSLKIIGGDKFDGHNASLVVIDNPNISDLFSPSQNITIKRGRFFFHYNPKLCFWKIKELGDRTGVKNFMDVEVHPESNGDRVACHVVQIVIKVDKISQNHANISWGHYIPGVGEQLISYLLSYIATDRKDITYETNNCGNRLWTLVDVPVPKNDSAVVRATISGLQPYTKYAVYVKTLSIINNRTFKPIGQSQIIFFQTENSRPTEPVNVHSFAVSTSEIIVKWSPPERSNGPIGHYIVKGYLRNNDPNLPIYRNYCKHDIDDKEEVLEIVPQVTEKPVPNDSSCCRKEDSKMRRYEDTTKKPQMTKLLENLCTENREDSLDANNCASYKYTIGESEFQNAVDGIPYIAALDKRIEDEHKGPLDDKKTRKYNGLYYSFVFNVSAERNEYIISNLKHFSMYTISVQVCSSPLSDGSVLCSFVQYTRSRTMKKPAADNVENLRANVYNSSVTVSWDPVKDPNGLTVAYIVQYINTKVQGTKVDECIPNDPAVYEHGRSFKYHISNLNPGWC